MIVKGVARERLQQRRVALIDVIAIIILGQHRRRTIGVIVIIGDGQLFFNLKTSRQSNHPKKLK